MTKLRAWIARNRLEAIALFFLISVAGFFRFYRIAEYMTFLGDEGRDALMIKRILTTFDLPLIGPPTSIGNMYLGPLYYYMMSIPMAISWLNPVAAAVMVAVISLGTIGLIYYLAREWFGPIPAFVAAWLYAISPLTIIYSRSSWNPNPAPFFALLAILSIYLSRKHADYRWLILTGISAAFLIQMHYLALILLPVLGLLWKYELLERRLKGKQLPHFWKGTMIGVVLFLVLMSPLVIFDFKHGFTNYRALNSFFGNRETTVNLNALNSLARTIPILNTNLIGDHMAPKSENSLPVTLILMIGLIVGIVYFFRSMNNWPYFVIGTWLVIGIIGLSLYKQTIYAHYLGFLNPVPYLLLAATLALIKTQKLRLVLSLLVLIVLSIINFQDNPIQYGPNRQLQRTQEISKFVIAQSNNQPYNFALIAKSNYDAAYQFYLGYYGHKPKDVAVEATEQLFIVCEDQICNPIGHPKHEIAAFGWALIDKEQEFSGVKVFRLVPNPAEEQQLQQQPSQ